MPITDILERNARLHPNEAALTELTPQNQPERNVTWREFNLIETAEGAQYRREITWRQFDTYANRFANLLFTRGIKKGDKVAILLMNCIEWLPIYFGVLKTGALAVPMNYRYTGEEIRYCADLADCTMMLFGPEFTTRVESVRDQLPRVKDYFFVGNSSETPGFASNYMDMIYHCSSVVPPVEVTDDDDAAIYFSSGTTGFPKAILHSHRALMTSARTEQAHHGQTRNDVFVCIPPLY
ncbi:MAG: acyl--CoA ligase, partial [Clostridia bacterium]|nr:acyl--CoA ligase [Clostridia bacterium]